MIKVGTPLGAAKLKMQAEGFDPSILDLDPDGPSPNNVPAGAPPAAEVSAPTGPPNPLALYHASSTKTANASRRRHLDGVPWPRCRVWLALVVGGGR